MSQTSDADTVAKYEVWVGLQPYTQGKQKGVKDPAIFWALDKIMPDCLFGEWLVS